MSEHDRPDQATSVRVVELDHEIHGLASELDVERAAFEERKPLQDGRAGGAEKIASSTFPDRSAGAVRRHKLENGGRQGDRDGEAMYDLTRDAGDVD